MNLGMHLARQAVRRPDHPAIIDRGAVITYAELDRTAGRLARGLLALGLRRGDRVATLMDNSAVALVTYCAAARSGLVAVPLNFRMSTAELSNVLDDAEVEVLIHDQAHSSLVRQAQQTTVHPVPHCHEVDVTTVGGPDVGLPPALIAPSDIEVPVPEPDESDLLLLIFTSGTTGRAKGVCLTHGQQLAHTTVAALEYGLDADSRSLLAYPHSSAASWGITVLPSFMLGATVVVESVVHFRAPRFFDHLVAHAITHTALVPTQVIRLLELAAAGRTPPRSLRSLGYGSAALPPDRVRQALDLFGPILVQIYGMSETCSIATMLSVCDHVEALREAPQRLASCGRPSFAIEVEVVDEDGRPLPVGEMGEIRFRGPHVSTGYWRAPEVSAAAFRDGWLYSGDLARVDEDGFVYIVDRKKDIILTGGANVAGREVEDVLHRHPSVLECAVVGLPDEHWGERVHAVVVLRDGEQPDEAELRTWSTAELADYKRPRSYQFVDELPRNATGKVLKNVLRRPPDRG